jgi:hypothetical protein
MIFFLLIFFLFILLLLFFSFRLFATRIVTRRSQGDLIPTNQPAAAVV